MHSTKNKCEKCFLKHLLKGRFKYRKISEDVPANFLRKAEPAYGDGLNTPSGETRPNPREISNKIMNQDSPYPNKKCATNMFWLWGQFIDHDITLTETANESFNISVPKGDKYFDPECTGTEEISFTRSGFNPKTGINNIPREQQNSITPLLDGTSIYGTNKETTDYLRAYKDGLLKTSFGGYLPFNDKSQNIAGDPATSYFVAGDVRCNEHIGLVSIHTILVREHNYWAKKIKELCPKLCDETIYQKAKIIVEAEIQAITYNEFLPLLFGKKFKYNGYCKSINPQITNEFATAAYRFGHSLVSSDMYDEYEFKNTFFSSHLICNNGGIDHIIDTFIKTRCEELDAKIVHDLRNFLFGEPGEGGHDLASLNIQRGRDHGIPDYNTVREACGLEKIESFCEITKDKCKQKKLKEVYRDVDSIDLFVGGLCEDHICKGMVGPTFYKILKDQFLRIRDGDYFWYERRLNKYMVKFINNTRLSDIIRRTTCVDDVPDNVFSLKYECSACKCCN